MKKNAFSGVGFILFVFVFTLVTVLTMEYYRVYTLMESVKTEISRALNISVDTAMLDADWITHDSVMDTDTAEAEFDSYLREEMGLNRQYEKYDSDGELLYRIIITETTIQRSPAKYSVKGSVRMKPALLKNFFDNSYTFDIPFSEESKNTRYDD